MNPVGLKLVGDNQDDVRTQRILGVACQAKGGCTQDQEGRDPFYLLPLTLKDPSRGVHGIPWNKNARSAWERIPL